MNKSEQLKMLYKINNKNRNRIQLTKDEINFLYELEEYHLYDGSKKIELVKDIKATRSIVDDIAYAYSCKRNQISLEGGPCTNDIVYYKGNIFYPDCYDMTQNDLPTVIDGDLVLNGLSELSNFVFSKSVKQFFVMDNLKIANKVIFPRYVGYSALLRDLEYSENTLLPRVVRGDMNLSNLKSAKGLVLPEVIGNCLALNSLETLEGIIIPDGVEEYCVHSNRKILNALEYEVKRKGGKVYKI